MNFYVRTLREKLSDYDNEDLIKVQLSRPNFEGIFIIEFRSLGELYLGEEGKQYQEPLWYYLFAEKGLNIKCCISQANNNQLLPRRDKHLDVHIICAAADIEDRTEEERVPDDKGQAVEKGLQEDGRVGQMIDGGLNCYLCDWMV